MHTTQGEPAGVLKLSGAFDIGVADTLRTALTECVSLESDPTVDLSGVDSCDTTALQLLCAARKSALRANKTFCVAGLSPVVSDAIAMLGLSAEELGIVPERDSRQFAGRADSADRGC